MSATLSATSTASEAVTVMITGRPTFVIAFRSTPNPRAARAAGTNLPPAHGGGGIKGLRREWRRGGQQERRQQQAREV